MTETPDGLAIDPASLVTEAVPVTAPTSGAKFKVGDQVRSPRAGVTMIVMANEGDDFDQMAPGRLARKAYCQADGWPHPRWFREDDLVRA